MEYNIAQILYDEINRIREKFNQEIKSYRQLTSYFGIKLYHSDLDNNVLEADSYNIRKNGKSIDRKTNPYIDIISKEDGSGIDIYVKENYCYISSNYFDYSVV